MQAGSGLTDTSARLLLLCTQEDVAAAINLDALVDAVVGGYHATVFAYGHTGLAWDVQ
jgi:hypothetical protein